MPDHLPYGVCFSHSAKNKAVVRPLAERLRNDGLKVWFDEWVLKPRIPLAHRMGEGSGVRAAKIEEGLEHFQFGFRICEARHVGECVRLGLGAVADPLSTLNFQLSTNSRPAEQRAPLHSPRGSTIPQTTTSATPGRNPPNNSVEQ
ncbi:MAG: toll/interleukin-1 receptor domain-containing protein [Verrucomicrobia bacterium]|nr:toll/interleukin-1 receptor domain-containing protein [Verrucomicrobiota bacterium]